MSKTRKALTLTSLGGVAITVLVVAIIFISSANVVGNTHSVSIKNITSIISTATATPPPETFYPVTNKGILYMLNGQTGAIRWQKQIGKYSACTTPQIDGDIVYCNSDQGIFALKSSDGTLVWSKQGVIENNYPIMAHFDTTNVYFITGPNEMTAFRASDGTQVWRYQGSTQAPDFAPLDNGSSIIANGIIYFGTGTLYAVNTIDGTLRWKFRDTSPNPVFASHSFAISGSLYSANGNIYFNNDDRTFYAVNATSGTVAWTFPSNSILGVVDKDVVGVVFGSGGKFVNTIGTLNAITGKLLWSRVPGDLDVYTNMYLYNDTLYYFAIAAIPGGLSATGPGGFDLHAVKALDGSQIWTLPNSDCIFSETSLRQNALMYALDSAYACGLDLANGTITWKVLINKRSTIANMTIDAQIINGAIITFNFDALDAGHTNCNATALSLTDGSVLWQNLLLCQ